MFLDMKIVRQLKFQNILLFIVTKTQLLNKMRDSQFKSNDDVEILDDKEIQAPSNLKISEKKEYTTKNNNEDLTKKNNEELLQEKHEIKNESSNKDEELQQEHKNISNIKNTGQEVFLCKSQIFQNDLKYQKSAKENKGNCQEIDEINKLSETEYEKAKNTNKKQSETSNNYFKHPLTPNTLNRCLEKECCAVDNSNLVYCENYVKNTVDNIENGIFCNNLNMKSYNDHLKHDFSYKKYPELLNFKNSIKTTLENIKNINIDEKQTFSDLKPVLKTEKQSLTDIKQKYGKDNQNFNENKQKITEKRRTCKNMEFKIEKGLNAGFNKTNIEKCIYPQTKMVDTLKESQLSSDKLNNSCEASDEKIKIDEKECNRSEGDTKTIDRTKDLTCYSSEVFKNDNVTLETSKNDSIFCESKKITPSFINEFSDKVNSIMDSKKNIESFKECFEDLDETVKDMYLLDKQLKEIDNRIKIYDLIDILSDCGEEGFNNMNYNELKGIIVECNSALKFFEKEINYNSIRSNQNKTTKIDEIMCTENKESIKNKKMEFKASNNNSINLKTSPNNTFNMIENNNDEIPTSEIKDATINAIEPSKKNLGIENDKNSPEIYIKKSKNILKTTIKVIHLKIKEELKKDSTIFLKDKDMLETVNSLPKNDILKIKYRYLRNRKNHVLAIKNNIIGNPVNIKNAKYISTTLVILIKQEMYFFFTIFKDEWINIVIKGIFDEFLLSCIRSLFKELTSDTVEKIKKENLEEIEKLGSRKILDKLRKNIRQINLDSLEKTECSKQISIMQNKDVFEKFFNFTNIETISISRIFLENILNNIIEDHENSLSDEYVFEI